MQTLYIKELESIEANNILEKIKIWYKKIFNIFEIKTIDNIVICGIPYKENIKEKKLKKISIKLCKKFFTEFQLKERKKKVIKLSKLNKEYFINRVVLSEKLKINEIIKNEINRYKVDILNGRWLFKYLIIDILEYICKKGNTKLEEKNIAILINNSSEINLNLIKLIAQRVKRLTIVTNDIIRFKYIEEKLYNDYGIAIEVSNNRRKSIAKTDIIINMDFTEEMLNKYKINLKSIIINVNEKIKIYTKLFNGININYYNIIYKEIKLFSENELYKYFDANVLYESYIYRKDNLNNILDQIKKDKVEVTQVIGNKDRINYEEFALNTLDKIKKLS